MGGGGGGGSVCDGPGKALCSGKIMLNNTLFIVSYCLIEVIATVLTPLL